MFFYENLDGKVYVELNSGGMNVEAFYDQLFTFFREHGYNYIDGRGLTMEQIEKEMYGEPIVDNRTEAQKEQDEKDFWELFEF